MKSNFNYENFNIIIIKIEEEIQNLKSLFAFDNSKQNSKSINRNIIDEISDKISDKINNEQSHLIDEVNLIRHDSYVQKTDLISSLKKEKLITDSFSSVTEEDLSSCEQFNDNYRYSQISKITHPIKKESKQSIKELKGKYDSAKKLKNSKTLKIGNGFSNINSLNNKSKQLDKNYQRKSYKSSKITYSKQIENFQEFKSQNKKSEPLNYNQITDSYGNIIIFAKNELKVDYFKQFIEKSQISEESNFIQDWNILIMLIMIFYILIFPFEQFSETWIKSYYLFVQINLLFEYIFIADIIINFFTAQKDEYGHSVIVLKFIAINYIKTWFLIDFVSSFPANNLLQFNFNSLDFYTQYIKLLKLPKYFRMFRAQVQIFTSKFSNIINFDIFKFSNSQQNLQITTSKYAASFIIISNILVCYYNSQVDQCDDYETCNNWFFTISKSQQEYSLFKESDQWHKLAVHSNQTTQSIEEAELDFYNMAKSGRLLVQLNSWYQILQTVTTVGQGDIGTNNSEERIFRSICMIIGVILQSILSSKILESTISESQNIQRSIYNEEMIEKLAFKQDISGESRRFLNLLGDSVFTESLKKELNFAKLLPRYMSDKVLHHIFNIYKNKLNLLREENIELFIDFMIESRQRRCVFDENITEFFSRKISILQNGQIGCQLAHCDDVLYGEQLYYNNIGSEMGWTSFLDFPKSSYNQIQTCVSNCELVEIQADKLQHLMLKSNKGLEYIFENLENVFVDLQIILAIQQCKLSCGLQIDTNWQYKIIIQLKLNEKDFRIMDNLCVKFSKDMSFRELFVGDRLNSKWHTGIFSDEIMKQIQFRSRQLVNEKISDKQPILQNSLKSKILHRRKSKI